MKKLLCVFLLLPLLALADGFTAGKNNNAQTSFTANDYTLLTWATSTHVPSGTFSNNGWTPVPSSATEAKQVCFGGQIWVRENATGNPPNYVAKIIKNGYPGQHQIAGICSYGTFPNSMVIPISGVDLAQLGDEYRIYLFATNSNAIVDGHPAHTWFSGAVIG